MTPAIALISLGVLFLAGLAIDTLGRRTHLPRVTLLIVLGVLIGPPGLDLLPGDVAQVGELLAPPALTMVAFLLGGSLKREKLRSQGRAILFVSITIVATSFIVVSGGLYLAGVALPFAVLLGGIATATDPAATRDVINQLGAKGHFPDVLSGIVAIDDAWGILVFSLALAIAGILTGGDINAHLWDGLREAGGAVGLGLAIGLPAAYLTGRIKPGEPTLIEALGVVCLCAGLALYLDFSFLLTGMVAGAVVVNFARHHEQPFHEIERIEWPFMLLFFVLAGASFQPAHLAILGVTGAAYIGLRAISRVVGGWIGGALARQPQQESRLIGLALMPQAGVAVGMALVASERFPEFSEPILAVTIASTIVFELTGPILTLFVLKRIKN